MTGDAPLAVTRAFATNRDTAVALVEAVAALASTLPALCCALSFSEQGKPRVLARSSTQSASPITEAEFASMEEIASRGGGKVRILGEEIDYSLARTIHVSRDVREVALASGVFDLAARKGFERACEELAHVLMGRSASDEKVREREEAERELRRSEERLRTFLDESRDLVYTVNAEDRIASINRGGIALLGLRDRFDAIGRPFADFCLNESDREHELHRIESDGLVDDFEIALRRADGSTAYCLESARAVRLRGGGILEIQGIAKDITERMRRESELWRANLELAAANERIRETHMRMVQQEKLASIGQLAAGVAHEINNPLGFLKSNHETLKRYAAKFANAWSMAVEAAPDALASIDADRRLARTFASIETLFKESDEGYDRIVAIVKGLKDFSRVDRGEGFGPYDIDRAVESTMTVARSEVAGVADVELRLGGIPPFPAAGGELNQVILNLVVNAAHAVGEARPGGRGRIRVTTEIVGDMARCSVDDDGAGVPESAKHQVFDPFFTTKEPGKGTGLGLSISYDIIVNRHGGRISVEDSDLGGARFVFEVPMRRGAEDDGE